MNKETSAVAEVADLPVAKAQTPLVRFVVDLLYNKLYSKSTANPQQIHSFSTNPQQIHSFSTNPQQIHSFSTTFRQIHNFSTTFRQIQVNGLQPLQVLESMAWWLEI
jgi:hypothetical protein